SSLQRPGCCITWVGSSGITPCRHPIPWGSAWTASAAASSWSAVWLWATSWTTTRSGRMCRRCNKQEGNILMPYIHFTEEQKQRANSVDLEEFLLRSGERLLPSGREK